ncbi:MAG TPA: glycoside hydrolase family 3 N-terminal domain-containing protein [Acidobacteriota bacterium]|jgi:beta-N-acetylhexosaminidase
MPSISDLAGQSLIVGFEGTTLDAASIAALSDLRPAGFILFSRNLKERTQIRELMEDLRYLFTPRLVCIDQEGGRVDRLRAVFPPFPSPESLALSREDQIFHQYGRLTGEVLRAFGFNVNFAPVLDLRFNDADNALRSRYLGRDPHQVSVFAKQYLTGLQSAEVLGCGKHFPGLGRATTDSHIELPSIDASPDQLLSEDLLPYGRLKEELRMVMINHAAYTQLEGTEPNVENRENKTAVPASCAPEVYRLLRQNLRYSGIALTDDLDMGAVHQSIPRERIAPGCFLAGADLLIIGKDLDFARLCRDQLAKLFERESLAQEARRRAENLNALPPVPAIQLESVAALERAFVDWKTTLGL